MSLFSCIPTIRCIAKCSIFIVVAIFSIQFWLERKSYLFDEKAVSAIAKDHVGTTDPQMSYRKILGTFQRRYPGHILGDGDMQWIFINAGGWMGSMCLVHASLTEYVLFFGTAVWTSGHSGRYWANISDTILTGSFRQWKEGEINSVVYKPGDVVHHAWGEVAAVEWEGHTWMVEYGRGFIPSTLGFALSDTLFSTQDFVTLFYVLRIYAKALSLEVIAAWTDVRTAIKDML